MDKWTYPEMYRGTKEPTKEKQSKKWTNSEGAEDLREPTQKEQQDKGTYPEGTAEQINLLRRYSKVKEHIHRNRSETVTYPGGTEGPQSRARRSSTKWDSHGPENINIQLLLTQGNIIIALKN
jgi:hypothetical protein